jgi:coenzyme F420 biosynthesis associated uncharacterized protein
MAAGDGSELIDWNVARSTARFLVSGGPSVTRNEAFLAVDQLRTFAAESEQHVREFTGLVAPSAGAPVLIVDRLGWVQVNVDGFSVILEPLLEKLSARRSRMPGSTPSSLVGSRLTGAEVGAVLSYLAGKVLGQFEVFGAGDGGASVRPAVEGSGDMRGAQPTTGAGTLLLVAPNIVQVERELGVDSRDFRLWVCLHEETHRAQFGAVPWLREYVAGQIREFLGETEVDPMAIARRIGEAASVVVDAIRGGADTSILDVVQTPKQREILDRLTAVMSLLEGHADYVMDGVGPRVIPSVDEIRTKFQRRRSSPSGLDAVMRRLLGLDAKLRQYRDGERFVRQVVDAVGMAGFNHVWASPETLPSKEELHDPASWVARVHGRPALEG